MLAVVYTLIKYENDSAVAACAIQIQYKSGHTSTTLKNHHNANICVIQIQYVVCYRKKKL